MSTSLQILGALFVAIVGTLADHACQRDSDCIAACTQALSNSSICDDARCDHAYGHCACSGASLLQRDGGCKPPVVNWSDGSKVPAACGSASYDVLITASARATPDMSPKDFSTGELRNSTPFETLVSLCLGAALDRSPRDVVISNGRVKLHAKSSFNLLGNATRAATLFFDVELSFCAKEDIGSINKRIFERRFSKEAQCYAAMYPSTVRLLSLSHRSAPANEAARSTSTAQPLELPRSSERAGLQMKPVVLWSCTGLLSIAFILLLGSCCSLLVAKRHHKRNEVKSLKSAAGEDSVGPYDMPLNYLCPVAFACITQAFDAKDAAQEDPRWGNCLQLSVGDLVEVHATSGMWLYGRIHGNPEAAGFFPEGSVAWIGKALPCTLPGEPDADSASVTPTACIDLVACSETDLEHGLELF